MKKVKIISIGLVVGLIGVFCFNVYRVNQRICTQVRSDFATMYPGYKFTQCVVGAMDFLTVAKVDIYFRKSGDDSIYQERWTYFDTQKGWMKQEERTQSIDSMNDFELYPDTAHPNAKKLLTEDFYWSTIEETGPFGSDDGSDTFHGFRIWRMDHQEESPVVFLNELIEEWGYPTFDMDQIDTAQIKGLESRMLTGTGSAIIAIGFGQYVLEGKIDTDIRELTKEAIQRELTSNRLNQFRVDYIQTRKELLLKMLAVVDEM